MKLNQTQLETFRRKKMSMVFQRFGLLPHRTVVDNVAYGLEIVVEQDKRHETAIKWLESVGLQGYENQYLTTLRWSQQEWIGSTLCTDAEIYSWTKLSPP